MGSLPSGPVHPLINGLAISSQFVEEGYLSLFSPDVDFRAAKRIKVKNMKRATAMETNRVLLSYLLLPTSRFSQIIFEGSGAASTSGR